MVNRSVLANREIRRNGNENEPSITQRSTSDGFTCSTVATCAYGRSCPIFWKPRSAKDSRRILRSSWAASRPTFFYISRKHRRGGHSGGKKKREKKREKRDGCAPNVEETSACARCHVWRSSTPPLKNIRRSAKSGCDLVATTASSLKSGSKSNTVGLDSAVAIASSATGCADCAVGSSERTSASL